MSILRLSNVAVRTAHLVGVTLLVGAAIWDSGGTHVMPALWLTLGSGASLMLLEIAADASWIVQGRGLTTAVKLALLTLVPFAPAHSAPLLIVVLVVASVGSHMPRTFRHATIAELLGWWPQGADDMETKGEKR